MRRRSALSTSSSRRRVGGGGGGVTRSDLAWNPPTAEVLRAGPWTGPHYFLTFPLAFTTSQDSPTAPDVDTRLNADGTPVDPASLWHRFNPPSFSFHKGFGGEVRDRPLFKRAPRATITSPTDPNKKLDYRVQDKITECRQAMTSGHDGFLVDLLDVPVNAAQYDLTVKSKESSNGASDGAPLRWRQAVELSDAVAEVQRADGPVFHLMCMPDASTNATKSPAGLLCDAIKWLEDRNPGVWLRRNGALILAPYQPEVAPAGAETGVATYWADVISGLKARGFSSVFFMPCYSRLWTATPQHPTLASQTQALGRWGDRSPDTTNGETDQNRRMYYTIRNDYPGNLYLGNASKSDERPNQRNYFESDHGRQIRESWQNNIGDGATDAGGKLLHVKADYVQVITWNDYAEGAHIAPSDNQGWCGLDLSMYELIKYKTGAYPAIVRDALYLSHRLQPTDDAATMTYNGYTGSVVNVAGRTADTFTLTMGANTTATITFSSTRSTMASNLQTAIQGLSGMDTATVGQDPRSTGRYTVNHPAAFNPAAAAMSGSNGVTWRVETMTKRSGGTANQNTVGVVCFLTAPADVTVNVGGTVYTHAAVPAGRTNFYDPLLPLGTGLISVTAVREGITIANIATEAARTVSTTRPVQDMAYRWRKSLPNIEVT